MTTDNFEEIEENNFEESKEKNFEEIKENNLVNEERKDKAFKKAFHIPSYWENNKDFQDLATHEYAKKDAITSFNFITQKFHALGYSNKGNEKMIHDYLVYLIQDVLSNEGIAFITEDEMCELDFPDTFGKYTPDFIINPKNGKPIILDVYIGDDDSKSLNERKSKYMTFGTQTFDIKFVTKYNISSELEKIINKSNVDYIEKNIHLFTIEYTYWKSCIKLQKVICSNIDNIRFKKFPVHQDIEIFKEKVKRLVIQKLEYERKFANDMSSIYDK